MASTLRRLWTFYEMAMSQNLPPGVTAKDIEGEGRSCDCCGRGFFPRDDDQELCPRCERKEDEGDE